MPLSKPAIPSDAAIKKELNLIYKNQISLKKAKKKADKYCDESHDNNKILHLILRISAICITGVYIVMIMLVIYWYYYL